MPFPWICFSSSTSQALIAGLQEISGPCCLVRVHSTERRCPASSFSPHGVPDSQTRTRTSIFKVHAPIHDLVNSCTQREHIHQALQTRDNSALAVLSLDIFGQVSEVSVQWCPMRSRQSGLFSTPCSGASVESTKGDELVFPRGFAFEYALRDTEENTSSSLAVWPLVHV